VEVGGAGTLPRSINATRVEGLISLIGVLARRDGGGLSYVVAAAAIAGLSGAMGCSLGGAFGILGMAAGVVAGSAPVLLTARR